jgi:hypothetical protein
MFPKFLTIGLTIILLLSNNTAAQALRLKQGEVYEYKVIVKSLIHGGNQTVKIINDHEIYKGVAAIRIRSILTTVGMVNKLTGYYETEEMVLDAEGLYPLYLKRESRDNKGTEVEEVRFDYQRKIAYRRLVETKKPEQQMEIKLPGIVHDGLSLQFFLRKADLRPGAHHLYFYSNGSGSIKEVDYSAREVKRKLQLETKTYSEYLEIKSPEVNITIILANDAERYPLIIRKIAKVGKFEAKLVKAPTF